MPALPVILAGANLAGGFLNGITQLGMNNQSQQWSQHMYNMQKRDAVEFWNMQNEYNSPANQMARFKAAGLNPNLIYGQGNSGPAGSVQMPNVQTPQFRNPEFGNAVSGAGLTYMNALYDLDIKGAQLDNLRAQNSVIKAEGLLKQLGLDRGSFQYGQDMLLADTNAEIRRALLRQTNMGIDLAVRKDAREAATTSMSVQEAASRMLSQAKQREKDTVAIRQMEQIISNLRTDGAMKSLDLQLWKQGINPRDPMWSRIVGRYLEDILREGKGMLQSGSSLWDTLFSKSRPGGSW